MTELEQQLLNALQRLKRHYQERDAVMLPNMAKTSWVFVTFVLLAKSCTHWYDASAS